MTCVHTGTHPLQMVSFTEPDGSATSVPYSDIVIMERDAAGETLAIETSRVVITVTGQKLAELAKHIAQGTVSSVHPSEEKDRRDVGRRSFVEAIKVVEKASHALTVVSAMSFAWLSAT